MKQAEYNILDMIHDKIGQIEFALNSIEHFRKMKPDASYTAPPLWSENSFATWKEFRADREKYYVKNKIDPIDDFPLATFSMSEPGAITIIQDDFIDLLHVLRRKSFQAMRAEYVGSIFFAIDMTDTRLNYMLGSFNILQELDRKKQEDYRKRQEFHKKRTDKAKEEKRRKRDKQAVEIMTVFDELFSNRPIRHLSRNAIFRKIREARPVNVEKDMYLWSINTIRNALETYHKERKITLPPLRVSKH